ncbi:hypothetical protein BU14_0131s0019 [Porphyra umbilicalis]|uniref:indole-3-glycerol-phosphate synthase n=1 Tax=Porphyra umbilicalis TaxID=2786 RepID=A0A1X6PAS5_PORUM|nr:hypothetical protein BU14_0131s0019 [Porphyra umbilicalis]|eukprot:OSX77836.1 hypothetical protein BU14_0131s0019 [Porphyra umbilicalis]
MPPAFVPVMALPLLGTPPRPTGAAGAAPRPWRPGGGCPPPPPPLPHPPLPPRRCRVVVAAAAADDGGGGGGGTSGGGGGGKAGGARRALLRRKRAVADAASADAVAAAAAAADAAVTAASALRGGRRQSAGGLAATVRAAAAASRRTGAPPPVIAGVCGEGSLATARQAVRPPDGGGAAPGALALPPGASPFTGTYVGAVAVAVQTDPYFFFGDADDLPRLAAVLPAATPLLAADYAVHPLHVYAAAVGGATAVTLPAAGWSPAALREAVRLAGRLGLGAVVECGDAAQLDAALASGVEAVLLASRDDATLDGRLDAFPRLVADRAAALAAWGGVLLAEGDDGGDVGVAAEVAAHADGIVVHMVGDEGSEDHW